MLRFALPAIIALAGLGGGVGAAMLLRPSPEAETPLAAAGPCGDIDPTAEPVEESTASHDAPKAGAATPVPADPSEYVELGEQFVVPVIEDGRVAALVVLTLSVEIAPGFEPEIQAHKPKLRDLFLAELLAHANLGGFRGTFTANGAMDRLRRALRESGQARMGSDLRDVLILDINRQELS